MPLDLTSECNEFTARLDVLQSGPSKLNIFNIREALEDLTNWIETTSICITLLDVAFNTLQSVGKAIKKSKKKKTAESSQNEQVFSIVNERLCASRDILEETLKRLASFIATESAALDVASNFQIAKELDIEVSFIFFFVSNFYSIFVILTEPKGTSSNGGEKTYLELQQIVF